jgi:hypothetical protein
MAILSPHMPTLGLDDLTGSPVAWFIGAMLVGVVAGGAAALDRYRPRSVKAIVLRPEAISATRYTPEGA